jgi:hypothetical protein
LKLRAAPGAPFRVCVLSAASTLWTHAAGAVARDLAPVIDRDVLLSNRDLAVPRLRSEHQAGRIREEQHNRERGGKCEKTIEFHNSVPRVLDDYAENCQCGRPLHDFNACG